MSAGDFALAKMGQTRSSQRVVRPARQKYNFLADRRMSGSKYTFLGTPKISSKVKSPKHPKVSEPRAYEALFEYEAHLQFSPILQARKIY